MLKKKKLSSEGKGATVLGCTSWLPLEQRRPNKPFVVAVKRRRDEHVRNGLSPSGIQNREDSGAGMKIAKYGRHCVPHGKSGNLQRIPLHRPPRVKKNPAFLPLEKIC